MLLESLKKNETEPPGGYIKGEGTAYKIQIRGGVNECGTRSCNEDHVANE